MTNEREQTARRRDGAAGGSRSRELRELLSTAGIDAHAALEGIDVTSIEYDSRRVKPGALFVAVRGFTVDGHDYVRQAAERGAVAALVESETAGGEVDEVVVGDTRTAMALVSHEFYGRPSEHLVTHGVTGTNGKTTTTYLIDSIMREAGLVTGLVGTLGYRTGDRWEPGDRTSPESVDLARLLGSMVDEGVQTVAMEVSSHALALGRTTGVRYDTATFTNLSRDHLDFHGSLDEYKRAKRSFFDLLEGNGGKPGSAAIINADDEFGSELARKLRSSGRVEVLTYGISTGDIRASEIESGPSGTKAVFHTPAGGAAVRLRLVSAFNVMNALAAMGVAVTRSIAPDVAAAGLGRLGSVPGRLEPVEAGQRFAVVVDYAHTPDALEKALRALRDLRPERLIAVFGCGGDRDKGKRPIMGEIAVRNSDIVIVTSDNPRTEDPAAIIEDILSGPGSTSVSGAEVEVIEDRRDAIRRAITVAAPGDVVLIAGKGHEDYQILGTEKRHFDDREEAAAAIRRLAGR